MRASTGWRAGLTAGADGKGVAHGVDVDFAAEGAGGVDEPVAGLFVRVREGEAGHAGVGFGAVGGRGLDMDWWVGNGVGSGVDWGM